MKNLARLLLIPFLLSLTVFLTAENWQFRLKPCVGNSLYSGICQTGMILGVSDSNADGWDAADQTHPGHGMADPWLEGRFPHTSGAGWEGHYANYITDYRSPGFIDNSKNVWNIALVTNLTGQKTYDFEWHPDDLPNIPPHYDVKLQYQSTIIDMRTGGEPMADGYVGYSFSTTVTNPTMTITITRKPGYPYLVQGIDDIILDSFNPINVNLADCFDMEGAYTFTYSVAPSSYLDLSVVGSVLNLAPAYDFWDEVSDVPVVITATSNAPGNPQAQVTFDVSLAEGIPYVVDPIDPVEFTSLVTPASIDLSGVFGVTGFEDLYYDFIYHARVSQSVDGGIYTALPVYPYADFTGPITLTVIASTAGGNNASAAFQATLQSGIPYVHQVGNPLATEVVFTNWNTQNFLLTQVFGVTGNTTANYYTQPHSYLIQDIVNPIYYLGLNPALPLVGSTQTFLTCTAQNGSVQHYFLVTNNIQASQPPVLATPFGTIGIDQNDLHVISNLDDYFDDPDTPDLQYSVQLPQGSHLDVQINQTTNAATITPNPGWNGVEVITFVASDGTEEASGEATIVVDPTEPKPITGFMISVTSGTATLSWNPVTQDVNNEPVTNITYKIYAHATDADFVPSTETLLGTTSDTSYNISSSGYSKRFFRIVAVNGN